MPAPPDGIVTFLFTDIQGSTRLWEQYPQAMRAALQRHYALLRQIIEGCGGRMFKMLGDGVCAVFENADDGVRASRQAQRALHACPEPEVGLLRVRMALLTGEAERHEDDYLGNTVNRAARLCAIAHGGQVILAQSTVNLLNDWLADQEDARLVDLGLHRLKDLRDAEQVYQLRCPDFPFYDAPLRSLNQLPHNLPYQLTTLIGREEAIADIFLLLTGREIKKESGTRPPETDGWNPPVAPIQNPTSNLPKTSSVQNQGARLLTLTGTGGCGKTRLAVQVAAEAQDAFPDGVWFVELAPVTDAALLPQTIAQALRADVEQVGRSVRDTLIETLKQKSTLLVLDNCEQVIAAAAQIAEEVLRACPNVHILATSRESLNIRGETSYRVVPLSVPTSSTGLSVEGLLRFEAVRLFVERAQAANRNWNLTSQNAACVCGICRRLDGIPLALELAARRVKGMTVEVIADQLTDRFIRWQGNRTDPPRQQTLEAAIDWSYVLLSQGERALLARLSVFVGGFTMDAAQTVCGDVGKQVEEWRSGGVAENALPNSIFLPPEDVPDHLLRLVDKSLVTFEETEEKDGRYRLLETIRQYGLQRLADSDTAEQIHQRHVAWSLSLAEQAEPQLQGPEQAQWLDRLEREHDNLRAALQWCFWNEVRLKLASALWRFWYIRGFYSEGRGWLEGALARGGDVRPAVRANALNAVGILAMTQGDCEAAQRFCEESLHIYRSLHDRAGEAKALNNLGLVAHRLGDYATMRDRLEQCLLIYLELHEETLAARVLNNLGLVLILQKEYDDAYKYLIDSLTLAQKQGDKISTANALSNLGEIAQKRGDHHAADTYFKQSMTIRAELGNRHGISLSLMCLGESALFQQDYERAVILLSASEALRKAVSTPLAAQVQSEFESDITTLRSLLSNEAFHAAWTKGCSLEFEQMLAFAHQESEFRNTA